MNWFVSGFKIIAIVFFIQKPCEEDNDDLPLSVRFKLNQSTDTVDLVTGDELPDVEHIKEEEQADSQTNTTQSRKKRGRPKRGNAAKQDDLGNKETLFLFAIEGPAIVYFIFSCY